MNQCREKEVRHEKDLILVHFVLILVHFVVPGKLFALVGVWCSLLFDTFSKKKKMGFFLFKNPVFEKMFGGGGDCVSQTSGFSK